jgi:O-antigen ligase
VTTDQSGSYRIGVWRDTVRLIGSSPTVGSGFGAYADALPRFKTAAGHLTVEHAENDHLELLAEGGVAGALLAAAGALALFFSGLKGVREGEHRLSQALLAAALAGGAAICVHSAFDFNLHIPSNALLFALMASAMAASGPTGAGAWGSRLVVTASLLVSLLTPWTESRLGNGPLVRAARSAGTSLRRAGVERDVVARLHRRPAEAASWVVLAWLRSGPSRPDAGALGAWATHLDPTSPGIHGAVGRLPRD